MGHKYILPYALYRCEGYVSANLARKTTGFSEEDLSLMARKCAAATGGKKGSARVLTEPDMLAIYRMANH